MNKNKQRLLTWQSSILVLSILLSSCKMSLPAIPTISSTPAPSPTAQPTPIPLPPTIVETVPPIGSQVPLQGLLTIYFSEAMDKLSVQTGLAADFSGGFIYSWVDDATLTLAPRSPMPAASTVTFTLAGSARSTSGLPVQAPISFSYLTPGPLKVTQVLPSRESQEASPDSAVVVTFDQPVVPLGAEPASLPPALTLDPPTPGKGEWLNTSTYIFHGDPGLLGGVRYTVKVNPSLTATSGMGLDPNDPNLSWVFQTSLPQVEHIIGIDPSAQSSSTPGGTLFKVKGVGDGNTDLLPDSRIEVAFNQPMDPASVEAAFSLNGPSGSVAGAVTWNDKSSVMTFTPVALLERDSSYIASLGGAAKSLGGIQIGADSSVTLHTILPFAVLQTSFPRGSTRPWGTSLGITFTAPLAKYTDDDLRALITFDPSVGYSTFYVDGARVFFYQSFLPGRSYTIHFSSQLKDRYGQALGTDYTFPFREPDASPSLQFTTYQTTLFTLPSDPTLSVQAVNLDSINLTSSSMTLEDFLRYQGDYNFQQAYTPVDPRSWTVYPNLPRNDNQSVSISLSDSPLPTGFYFVKFDSPELQYHSNDVKILAVSNVNLTFKVSDTDALVWAVDLRTHTPVQGAAVKLYNAKGASYAGGTTDENGLWHGQFPQDPNTNYSAYNFAVIGQPGDDLFGIAATGWSSGVDAYSFGYRYGPPEPEPDAYLYTDRPIYRPGDTVHLRGSLRSWYDGRYSLTGINDLNLSWNGNNGSLGEQKVSLSAFGTFSADFALPRNAPPGYYYVSLDSPSLPADQYIPGSSIYFTVADYRKPEIDLSVTIDPQEAKSGASLSALIQANYFFGAPAADLAFTWRLYSQRSYFSIPEYATGVTLSSWLPLGSPGKFGSVNQQGQGRTDANGSFTLPLQDLQVDDTSVLTLEVTATESGGFPVSARAQATLHPENFYVGIRPDQWAGQAGTPMNFNLYSVDWASNPVSRTLNVAFEKVRWERKDTNGYPSFTPVYTPLFSRPATTGADGKAAISFTPPDAGTYVVDVTSGSAHSQVLLWVGGTDNAVWPNLPYQRLELTADKDKYEPGDTAQVFIPNPFNAPVQALLTVERSSLKSAQVVTIPAKGYQFDVPLDVDSAPNVYAAVTLLAPDGVDFRQGIVNLPVDPAAFTLNVDVKATPEKAKPGDTLTLDLAVTDSQGHPVQAEFSLAAVDLAMLALANPNSQDIVPAYYDIQPMGMFTGLTAAVATHRLQYEPGGKGGGGGEAITTIRSYFPDTAYWKADIVTDAQGKAQVSFKVPDSLTTWQVEARGLTASTQVGQVRLRVVTSKDLLIRPQTQRFFVVGDHAELAAMLNNNTNQALQATARLEAAGFSLDDPSKAALPVTIPAHASVRVSWMGTVQAVDQVDPLFSVSSTSLQDAARPNDGPIPVLRYSAPQTFSTGGSLTGASTRQEIIAVPRSYQALGGSLKVELSPSMAAVILGTLKSLEPADTPWSSEQVMSTLLPNIVTYRTLKDAGLSDPDLSARLQQDLKVDVSQVLVFQQADGGFKWTQSSTQADLYLTAYVVYGLQQVFLSNLDVGGIDLGSAIQRGSDYIDSILSDTRLADLSTPDQVNRTVFCYYAVFFSGRPTDRPDLLAWLYSADVQSKMDPWAKAMLLQVSYYNSGQVADKSIQTQISNLEGSAIRSATGAHWESSGRDILNPNSPLTTTAIVLQVLAERDPGSPLLADVVRYLASQQDPQGRWASSYETSWVIQALDKYMQVSADLGGNYSFSAALNGASLAQGQASGPQNMASVTTTAPLSSLLLAGSNSLLVSRSDGPGSLYYRAALSIDRPVETAPVLEQGISISRQYMDCSADPCTPITSYTLKPDMSGRVSVRLTVTLRNDAYYLTVQDFIPAGADILDTSLKTSQQGQQATNIATPYDPADPFANGWGWWLFNQPQIYSDHILWSADYLPAGTYELTYTIVPSLAGQYRILPAHAWLSYFPEVQGTSAGAVFEIKQ